MLLSTVRIGMLRVLDWGDLIVCQVVCQLVDVGAEAESVTGLPTVNSLDEHISASPSIMPSIS